MNARLSLLAEADLFLLFARLLERPDDEGFDTLRRLAAVRCEVLGHAGDSGSCGELLERLAAEIEQAPRQRLDDEHGRLFLGAIACPCDESAYVRRDKGQLLADVAGFYRAFGLLPHPERAEKLDHLPTELEFLALLLVLQAQAVERLLPVEAETTAQAIRSFAVDHLGEYLPDFTAALQAATREPFYGVLAEALEQFWRGFCSRRGITADAAGCRLPCAAAIDDSPTFECGGAASPTIGTTSCP